MCPYGSSREAPTHPNQSCCFVSWASACLKRWKGAGFYCLKTFGCVVPGLPQVPEFTAMLSRGPYPHLQGPGTLAFSPSLPHPPTLSPPPKLTLDLPT